MTDSDPIPTAPSEPPAPQPAAAPHRPYAPLTVPAYRWYLLSLLFISVAVQVQAAALFWQVFHLTGQELSCGLVGLAEAVPAIAFALFAGHVADLRDRRAIVLWSGAALLLGSIALVQLASLPQEPRLQWAIYAVAACSGCARSFLGPARSALGAELVPRAWYAAAVSLRTATWQCALVGGPALGGLLIAAAHGHLAPVYAVDAGAMALGLGCMALVRRTPPPRVADSEPLLTSLGGGLTFVFADRVLLSAMALDLFAVLFGGAMALLPAFAEKVLLVGPVAYGWLRAAPSAGAVAVAILLAHLPPLRRAGPIMLWSVAGFGACWIAIAESRSFALTVALLTASGACDYVSVVVRHTLVQMRTPNALLGRVSSVNAMFVGSSNEIGAFESGLAARWLGLVPSVVVGGAVTLGVVAVIAWASPGLRRLRRIDSAMP